MGPAVEQIALYGTHVVLPLLFQVDERPLAAAEGEVLDTGEGKEDCSVAEPMGFINCTDGRLVSLGGGGLLR